MLNVSNWVNTNKPMNYNLTLIRIGNTRRTVKCWQEYGKTEFLYTVGGNIK